MKELKTNQQAVFTGIRNAIGVPALLLFSAMTGFGSLAQEQGLSLYISILSTVLIWGMPGQVVHVELYGLGAPLIAVVLGVAGANARFMPMTLSMMPVFADSPHIENGIISFHISFPSTPGRKCTIVDVK